MMEDLPEYFNPLIDLITSYIEHRVDHWTLQTYNPRFSFGPYVQALLEHDDMILIEAVSNEFLDPPISTQGHQALLFMGWRFFAGAHYPNYAQMIDLGAIPAREIALRMVRALHFAYEVDDNFAFNMSPWVELKDKNLKLVGNE